MDIFKRHKSSNEISRNMYKNLYYMLCYAVDELKYMRLSDTDAESINGSADLLAELLIKTLDIWSKNNPLREYKEITFDTDKPTGRINVYESYASGVIYQGKMNCTQYKLNVDTIQNQIIKLALRVLLKCHDISVNKRTQLNKYYTQFDYVSTISEQEYRGIKSRANRNLPAYYKPVISASIIIINMMLSYNKQGNCRLYDLYDVERYKYIFEKFVRNFYICEYVTGNKKNGVEVKHPHYDKSIPGELTDIDKLDVLLINKSTAVIIDTKWYTKTENIKHNRVQMEAYMKDVLNFEKELAKGSIYGIVLYAKTPNDNIKCGRWKADITEVKRQLSARQEVIDMTREFEEIKKNLIELANQYMIP